MWYYNTAEWYCHDSGLFSFVYRAVWRISGKPLFLLAASTRSPNSPEISNVDPSPSQLSAFDATQARNVCCLCSAPYRGALLCSFLEWWSSNTKSGCSQSEWGIRKVPRSFIWPCTTFRFWGARKTDIDMGEGLPAADGVLLIALGIEWEVAHCII